jgi:hypothetical protein
VGPPPTLNATGDEPFLRWTIFEALVALLCAVGALASAYYSFTGDSDTDTVNRTRLFLFWAAALLVVSLLCLLDVRRRILDLREGPRYVRAAVNNKRRNGFLLGSILGLGGQVEVLRLPETQEEQEIQVPQEDHGPIASQNILLGQVGAGRLSESWRRDTQERPESPLSREIAGPIDFSDPLLGQLEVHRLSDAWRPEIQEQQDFRVSRGDVGPGGSGRPPMGHVDVHKLTEDLLMRTGGRQKFQVSGEDFGRIQTGDRLRLLQYPHTGVMAASDCYDTDAASFVRLSPVSGYAGVWDGMAYMSGSTAGALLLAGLALLLAPLWLLSYLAARVVSLGARHRNPIRG